MPGVGAGRPDRRGYSSRTRPATERRPEHHDEERRPQQQRHDRDAEPGDPGVEHQVLAGAEDLHGDQRGQQRHRHQVGDPLDDGVLEHPRGTDSPASLSR